MDSPRSRVSSVVQLLSGWNILIQLQNQPLPGLAGTAPSLYPEVTVASTISELQSHVIGLCIIAPP